MAKGFFQRRSVRFAVPFVVLVVGGSFALKEFTQLRYTFRNPRNVAKEQAEKLGIKMKEAHEVTIDTEFHKIKDVDTTNWENKRGPRPWEEDNKLYAEAVERKKTIQRDD